MSLDVYLYEITNPLPLEQCLECIAAPDDEEDGHTHRYCVFSQNVTHNLGRMADAAGIYEACWRPEELMDAAVAARINELETKYFADQRAETRYLYEEAQELREQQGVLVRAHHLVPLLRAGLAKLRANPVHYRTFEPEPDPHTGKPWGSYDGFVPWVEKYLAACEEHPNAAVRVSR